MAGHLISISVDAQPAEAYERATPEEKRKLHALLGLWIREFTDPNRPTLEQVLDEVGRTAPERGLTPEILEAILNEPTKD